MNEYVKTSVHALLAARRQATSPAVAGAIDEILAPERRTGPMQSEVLEPPLAVGGQIAHLREGRMGPLTAEQRQALNLIHGRLSHVTLMLRELHEGTALDSAQPYLETAVFS